MRSRASAASSARCVGVVPVRHRVRQRYGADLRLSDVSDRQERRPVRRGRPRLALANRGSARPPVPPLFPPDRRSWHMYPLGVLFGLGFDTATEVGLLGISADAASQGLSIWSILVFPGAVHRRHDADRHDRQHPDAGRLWLGLRQADPQALLQSDHHRGIGDRRRRRRRPRDAQSHRRSPRPDRWRRLLGRDRVAQRQFRRPRLRHRRVFIVAWLIATSSIAPIATTRSKSRRLSGFDRQRAIAAVGDRVAISAADHRAILARRAPRLGGKA